MPSLPGPLKRAVDSGNRTKDKLLGYYPIALIARTVKDFGSHDGTHMAASVSYYVFISLFPLLLGLISLFSIFLDSEDVQQQVSEFLNENLPVARDLVEENIEGLINARRGMGIFAIVGLLWTGSAVFGSISRAVNRAWGIGENRPFYIAKPRHLFMALSIGVLMLLSVVATSLIQILPKEDIPVIGDLGPIAVVLTDIGTRLVVFLISLLVFSLIYKFVPNTQTTWGQIWPGALLAAAAFEIGKSAFLWYLNEFGNYEQVYGSLASVVILMLWAYYSAIILIIGAEFITARDQLRVERTGSNVRREAGDGDETAGRDERASGNVGAAEQTSFVSDAPGDGYGHRTAEENPERGRPADDGRRDQSHDSRATGPVGAAAAAGVFLLAAKAIFSRSGRGSRRRRN
ncbi:MAG: YihY/virulence factor BrkB family protein [Dehalococcoidia bacterium]